VSDLQPGAWRRVIRRGWALPVSIAALPLVLLSLASGGRARRRGGALEVAGGLLSPLLTRAIPGFPICAITLGHVILASDARALSACRTHESVHVGQYERWGALFPLLYLLSSAAAWLGGRHAYRDNAFEREASRADGRSLPA